MRKKGRFTSSHVIIPVEFDSVFSGMPRENAGVVLRMLSRDSLVKLASLLKREYCGRPAQRMANLLSSSDIHFLPLLYQLQRHSEDTKHLKGAEVVVAFDNTPLELLRIAFSISPTEMNDVSPMRTDELQWRITKLIAQINQDSMKYSTAETPRSEFAQLLLVNDASYKDIYGIESKGQLIIQPVQAVLFFQLLESKPKYSGLLNAFYEYYGISSWKEYVKTIYTLSLLCFKKGEGIYPEDKLEQSENTLSRSVLERLSIASNEGVIPYACSDEYDEKGNSDYRVFKGRPLFKLSNGDFVIYNQSILIDRLFQGLYFDFHSIAKGLAENHPDIAHLFTSDFIEKTLFVSVVGDCISKCRYTAYNEDSLSQIHRLSSKELGYPDYFIRNNMRNSVMLFECKDIRLNAWIKERRDSALLERELENKLVNKTYQLDRENKCRKQLPKPRRIGVGQLAGHAANIRKGVFPWAEDLPVDVTIYPVLVIADNRLIYDGLPLLTQLWYYDCLDNEGCDKTVQDRPLIMMSPLTLIKYKKLFKVHGFEYYFEKYYEATSVKPKSATDLFNKVMSFETFMEQYSYSLQGLRKHLMKTIYDR